MMTVSVAQYLFWQAGFIPVRQFWQWTSGRRKGRDRCCNIPNSRPAN
jgi:hypothetical protein